MIKFEEHAGLIFKMLDSPVPLKEKDTNVLVRFITHGIIGEYVMEHWLDCNQENVPIFVKDVDSDGDVTVCIENGNEHICCPFPMFEIIGTPVAEGSAEWALYQMMQGNKVTKQHLQDSGNVYWCFCDRPRCVQEFNCGTLQIMVTPEIWVKTVDKCGWQIYTEPKPEPIFTTGDKVTDGVIEGTIIHIEDAIADVCPSTNEYKIELRNLNHIPESPKQDDVEKPLRSMIAEAKAIGKNIRTYYQDIVFTPQALEACLNQGKFRWWNICNWEFTEREQNYDSEPCPACNGTGKVEEPSQVVVKIGCLSGTVKDLFYAEDGRFWFIGKKTERCPGGMHAILYDEMLDTETRELVEGLLKAQDEDEVIINIGCLSGTVEDLSYEEDGRFWLVGKATERCSDGMYAILYDEMLDTHTAELVRELLKAQEEEK